MPVTNPSLVERALRDQRPTEDPATPRAAARAVGALFGAVSHLRGARSLHPSGVRAPDASATLSPPPS